MFHIVLHQPQIAPNTGNIIRLCANTGATLHLIEPLGFRIDDAKLRRAGLDYHEYASLKIHPDYRSFQAQMGQGRIWAIETCGKRTVDQAQFLSGDALLFGSETRGLPESVLASMASERILRLPMRAHSRSLNLANACAISLYEAWRQNHFAGAAGEALIESSGSLGSESGVGDR